MYIISKSANEKFCLIEKKNNCPLTNYDEDEFFDYFDDVYLVFFRSEQMTPIDEKFLSNEPWVSTTTQWIDSDDDVSENSKFGEISANEDEFSKALQVNTMFPFEGSPFNSAFRRRNWRTVITGLNCLWLNNVFSNF